MQNQAMPEMAPQIEEHKEEPRPVEEMKFDQMIGGERAGFVGQGAVAFNDNERRQQQILNQSEARSEEEVRREAERRSTVYCYLFGMIIIAITPIVDCSEHGRPSIHKLDFKEWILIFMALNTAYMCKYYFMNWVNSLYARERITYRTRRRIKTYLAYGFEVLILGW
jgi:hypothetical protein